MMTAETTATTAMTAATTTTAARSDVVLVEAAVVAAATEAALVAEDEQPRRRSDRMHVSVTTTTMAATTTRRPARKMTATTTRLTTTDNVMAEDTAVAAIPAPEGALVAEKLRCSGRERKAVAAIPAHEGALVAKKLRRSGQEHKTATTKKSVLTLKRAELPEEKMVVVTSMKKRKITMSGTTSSNATSNTEVAANRIVLNGDGGLSDVLTQEQIARCETNRLNALAIRARKMLQNSVTSTAVNGGLHGALTKEQIERKNSNRSIALAIREQNEQALQLDLDATRIRFMFPSIATATYDAGSKRPFSASNNDDVSTNARGGGDYGSAFGESIALSANAKTTVETRMPSFISSVSRQLSFAVEDSYSLANPEAHRTTTTTANNGELMSSLSSSSFLLPWESAHSSKIIEDDRKISAMSESALVTACPWLSRIVAGEALRNARGDVKSAIEAVTAALSPARKLTQEENACRLEIGNDDLFFGSFGINANSKPTKSTLSTSNDCLITEAAHAALTMEESLRDADEESWICSACTCINHNGRGLACIVCRTERMSAFSESMHDNYRAESTAESKTNVDHQRTQPAMAQKHTPNEHALCLELESSNNSELTSSKPSSNRKPKKKYPSTFQAPALKEFSLVYPASEEEALLNYNKSRQRLPAIWKKHIDSEFEAHVPPIVMPLPNNVVGTVTRGVLLHYPPKHKDNIYVKENGDAPDETTRLLGLSVSRACDPHLKFGQMNDIIWDLFCSSRAASSKFDFRKDEYDKWTTDKKSIWFTTLVELVAYFLLWQIKSGKKGIRIISLGDNPCHFWNKIITTALDRAIATLSENGVESSYFTEFFYSFHPSAHHNFLSRTDRQQLDRALTSFYAELLEQFGRRNELGEIVGISLFEDICPESDDIDEDLVRLMKCDSLMRTGGKEGSAVYELGREQTDEEIEEDRRCLFRGTKIRFLGNDWVNKQTKPLSEISDEEIDELHRRKCMIDAAGGEDEILAATRYTNIDDVPIEMMRPMAQRNGMMVRAGGKDEILAATGLTNIDDVPIEMMRPMAQRNGMMDAAGGKDEILAATGYTNIDDVPIEMMRPMAQRNGMMDRAGGKDEILAATGLTNIDDVPIEMMRPMAQRNGMMDRAGGKDEILAATGLTDINAVTIEMMRPIAQHNGMIDAAGGKKDILAAFRCTNINDIEIDVLVLLCAVGGVNTMLELLDVDSLVDVDISLLEEQTTFWTHLTDLKAYKKENNGDVCVPQNYAKNQQLATWVNNIRKRKQTKRREELLNSIGFVWNAHDADWEEMFNQLVKYKKLNGHTKVPRKSGLLGNWVKTQRYTLGKKRKMPENNSEKINERIDKLDSLGFKW